MLVHKVIEQRPFQSCADASVNPEAVAAQLYSALVVDKPEVGAKLHVVFGSKIKLRLFAARLNYLIVFLFSREQVVVGDIGHTGKSVVYICNQLRNLSVARGNLVAELSHLLKNRLDGLTCLFKHGYLRRHLIFLRLQLLHVGYKRLAHIVPRDNLVEISLKALFCQSVCHCLRIVSYSY